MVPFSDELALTRQESGLRMSLHPLFSCDARVGGLGGFRSPQPAPAEEDWEGGLLGLRDMSLSTRCIEAIIPLEI